MLFGSAFAWNVCTNVVDHSRERCAQLCPLRTHMCAHTLNGLATWNADRLTLRTASSCGPPKAAGRLKLRTASSLCVVFEHPGAEEISVTTMACLVLVVPPEQRVPHNKFPIAMLGEPLVRKTIVKQ